MTWDEIADECDKLRAQNSKLQGEVKTLRKEADVLNGDLTEITSSEIRAKKKIGEYHLLTNELQDELGKLKAKQPMSEREIWDTLITVHGCKKDKEDCLYVRCHNWVKCEMLAKALFERVAKKEKR